MIPTQLHRFGRLILGACAAAGLAAPAMAAPAPSANDQAAPAALTAPAPPAADAVSRREFPGGVVAMTDITYSRITGYRPLKLDLYTTRTPSGPPKPVVIWLHGGGWNVGDQRGGGIATPAYRNWPAVLAQLAGRGYVVAGVAYRFSSEIKSPAAMMDVKAAVRWLRANAATYNIDPNKVIIWGASAGAQIGNVVGTSCNVPELEGEKAKGAEGSSCVQGVVDFYGPTDFKQEDSQRISEDSLRHNPATSSASMFLGCAIQTCPAEQLRLSNAIAFVDRSDPPFLIVHGDADKRVPPKQSQILHDALVKAGVKSELVWVPGTDHIFAGATDAKGKEILDKVFAWLDATTGTKPAS